MIKLDTTTRKIQAVLGGAITTNQLPCTVSYSDDNGTTYVGGTQLTNTNNTTAVDICAAPAASTVRDIDYLSIKNNDTASATVTVMLDDNGTDYEIAKVALSAGDQLTYTHGRGWAVIDTSGNAKSTGGGSISDGDKGDITVSGSGATWTIDNDAVTYAKIQNVSATDKVLGRSTAGAGDVEEIACTAFARSILDDADEATFKATVNLEIGTDVQAYDADLSAIAALAKTDGNIIVGDGATWVAESGATARTSLGLGTGDSPQFTGIELGHASDTTLTRVSAGVVAIEGTNIVKAGAATSSGLTMATARLLGRTTASTGAIEEITVGSGLSLSAGSLTATGGSGGITLGTAVASTSGTSIDFTSIPAGTKRITINFAGVSTTGTSNMMVQIGDSGGIENTGYASGATNDNGTRVTSTAGFVIVSATVAGSFFSGRVTLELLNASTYKWVSVGQLCDTASGMDGESGGNKSLSAELDRVRITTVGGTDTFDAGEINITYE